MPPCFSKKFQVVHVTPLCKAVCVVGFKVSIDQGLFSFDFAWFMSWRFGSLTGLPGRKQEPKRLWASRDYPKL